MTSTPVHDEQHTAAFIGQLTAHQSRLYGFVHCLLHDAELTWDVLQETNLVLWRKSDQYDPRRPFLPWAFAIAYRQVLAARKRLGRDRLVFHDPLTLEQINRHYTAQAHDNTTGDLAVALDRCLEQLPDEHRRLLEMYYRLGQDLRQIGRQLQRTANAVAVALHRIRQALARCIRQALADDPAAARPGTDGLP